MRPTKLTRILVLLSVLVAISTGLSADGDPWTRWFLPLTADAPAPYLSGGPVSYDSVWAPLVVQSSYLPFQDGAWGDGSWWQGTGLNLAVSGGLRGRSGDWSFRLEPEFWAAQNQTTLSTGQEDYPYSDLHYSSWDHPIRMGDGALWRLYPGQTELAWSPGPFRFSLGSVGRTWGASRSNSLLLAENGPGVPAVELSLEPWMTPAGTFEIHYLAGYLEATEWRYDTTTDGARSWVGLYFAYSPPGLGGLTFSLARNSLGRWSNLSVGTFLIPLLLKAKWGVDESDQRLSAGFRWRFPEVGFEVFGEMGRNDYSPSWKKMIQNWERTLVSQFGLRKLLTNSWGNWGLEAEFVNTSLSPEAFINANGYSPAGADFYVHWLLTEGYTIAGQDLGAAVGQGILASAACFWNHGDLTAKLELRRWVKDYSVLLATLDSTGELKVDTVLEAEARLWWVWGAMKLSGGFTLVREISPLFLGTDQDRSGVGLYLGWETQL